MVVVRHEDDVDRPDVDGGTAGPSSFVSTTGVPELSYRPGGSNVGSVRMRRPP